MFLCPRAPTGNLHNRGSTAVDRGPFSRAFAETSRRYLDSPSRSELTSDPYLQRIVLGFYPRIQGPPGMPMLLAGAQMRHHCGKRNERRLRIPRIPATCNPDVEGSDRPTPPGHGQHRIGRKSRLYRWTMIDRPATRRCHSRRGHRLHTW